MKSARLLSLRDLKAEYGLTYWQAYAIAVQKKLLPVVKLNGRLYVDRSDLDGLIDRSKEAA
jgi:hypothetical protein